jgi:Zn-dependent protease with chaperone function
LIAARPFARAAVRYRILAAGFALAAAVGPLALLAARFRTAPLPAAGSGGVAGALALPNLAPPGLALAATVAAVLLLDLAVEVVKLRRVKRGATLLGTLGVRRARIGTSRTVATPTAIGYVHPAVVLPENFADRVDEREWDAVVAHECAHLARGDDWAKAIQSALLRAGWWLPGLWVLNRALDLERELASDERAAAQTGARRYAACLLRLATDRGTDALAPAFGARRSHVAIRVERLVRPVRGGGPLVRATALGAFTALAFGLVGAAVFALPGTAARPLAIRHTARHDAAVAAPHLAQRMRHPGQLAHGRTVALAGPANAIAYRPAAELPATERAAAEGPATQRSAAERPVPPARSAVRAPRAAARAFVASTAAVRRQATAAARAAEAARAHRTAWLAARTFAFLALEARRAETAAGGAARRPPPVRASASPSETLAFAAVPRKRCGTCFGPLRSADEAVGTQTTALAPQGGSPGGGSAAIAADDPTAGPVSLTNQMLWFRIPAKVMQRP